MAAVTYKGEHGIYIVEESQPIAYGRVSVLLRGRDEKGYEVVIKVYRTEPRAKQEFLRQIAAQQSLTHHNVLPILDHGENSYPTPVLFLVMPFCRGGNLRKLIQSRDFLSTSTVLAILEQISFAVDYAHNNGFVHGDIKPENILFPSDTSHAYLSDFGSAKFFPVSGVISDVSDESELSGTSAYLSPEQLLEARQSTASDIYALSVVAYEMFTGRLPYTIDLPIYHLMKAKVEGDIIDPLKYN